MDSLLLYFVIGLAIFAAKLMTDKVSIRIRLWIYLLAGSLAGGLVGLLAGAPLAPVVELPGTVLIPIGFTAGLLCFGIEAMGLMQDRALQFMATIIPGAILGAVSWGLCWIIIQLTHVPVRASIAPMQTAIIFAGVGFVTIMGYTFPERWFRQRVLHHEESNS